ncbi:hypothetical protein MBLNU459_g0245t1 [Dothideomycetes sp. NU459]
MSFSATGVPKPLQPKRKTNPFLKRSSSSPFSSLPRRKSSHSQPATKRSRSEENHEPQEDRLDDSGIVTSVPPRHVQQNVVTLMKYIHDSMWDDIPERAAGMNSTRIAEVLNFRRSLPAILSVAHLHAVSKSTTTTERELARLIQDGTIRKINVFGRGKGGAAIGEGLVLVEEWRRLVEENTILTEGAKEKYLALLADNPSSPTVPASSLDGPEAIELISAGFMTSTSALANNTELFCRPGVFTLGTSVSVCKAGSSAATGTLAAIGGSGAVHSSGGGGRGLNSSSSTSRMTGDLTFSLPATGTYLKLLTEARTHLLQLLAKSSPRYKEAVKGMLRERWEGGIPAEDPASRAKRARGEWIGVLPGKTKKWKSFYGMTFSWILEECLGSGSIECFQTGSVGLGVRAT